MIIGAILFTSGLLTMLWAASGSEKEKPVESETVTDTGHDVQIFSDDNRMVAYLDGINWTVDDPEVAMQVIYRDYKETGHALSVCRGEIFSQDNQISKLQKSLTAADTANTKLRRLLMQNYELIEKYQERFLGLKKKKP